MAVHGAKNATALKPPPRCLPAAFGLWPVVSKKRALVRKCSYTRRFTLSNSLHSTVAIAVFFSRARPPA